jgi:hypothetical protein
MRTGEETWQIRIIFMRTGEETWQIRIIFMRTGEETWQIRIIFTPPPLTALIFTKLAAVYC